MLIGKRAKAAFGAWFNCYNLYMLPSLNCFTLANPSSILRSRTSLPTQHRALLSSLYPSASFARVAQQILQLRGQSSHATFSSPTRVSLISSSLLRNSTTRQFSSTPAAMTATKIDGTAIAKKIREKIHAEIDDAQKTNPRFKPSLKIIQVGDRSDSTTYVRMKLKAAQEAAIECELIPFPETATEAEVLDEIERLNNDPSVHGILVQLPVPKHMSEYSITSAVSDEKDVDGFGASNIGELAKRGGRPLFIPCTPKGVMVLLEESGVDLKGKNAVVLGRSNIVGSPTSYLLKNADATVTVCHSRTQNIEQFIKNADVVVAAIGKANFVKGEWLKPGAVVIDVGTNFIPDETKKSGQRLVGDVDFESASEVASQITPVPGGVGPMTIAMLLQNVVESAKAYFDQQKAKAIKPL